MVILRYSSFLVLFSFVSLFAENINYAKHDVHTQTIYKNQLELSLEYSLLNDTVDVLKLKESEFGNSSITDSVGDLKGYGIKLRYGITDDLMAHLSLSKKHLLYYDEELSNLQTDFFEIQSF